MVIEVAHLDHNTANNDPRNLLAMCHQCHVLYDSLDGGPRRVRHASEERPTLAVQGSAVLSSAVQGSTEATAAAAPTLDYVTRCCIAVNRVLEQQLAGAFSPLVANVERPTARAWESAGIPIEVAEQVLAELAGRFPNDRGRQPKTLGYFTAAIHEAHAKHQAGNGGGALKPYERMARAAAELRDQKGETSR